MKFGFIAIAIVGLALTHSAEAQVVGHRAPVVVPAEFISSSSPATDGRIVTTYSGTTSAANEPTGIVVPVSSSRPTITYSSQRAYVAQAPPIAAETPPALVPQPQFGSNTLSAPLTIPDGGSCACAPAGGVSIYPPMQVYRPQTVIATKPVPSGTYVGKGLVGQVKAYVDGQPVRNFFRYILP